MKTMMKKFERFVNNIFRISLGAFDIFWALYVLLGATFRSQHAVRTSGFILSACALLGVIYIIFAIALVSRKIWWRKLFFLGIVPASILVVLNVKIIGELVDASSVWSSTDQQIGFIMVYVGIPLILNAPGLLLNSKN